MPTVDLLTSFGLVARLAAFHAVGALRSRCSG